MSVRRRGAPATRAISSIREDGMSITPEEVCQ